MNDPEEREQSGASSKTATAAVLRAFAAEYDMKITPDVRDLWEKT